MSGYAAVDCGTNSTRLLIADEDGQPIVRELRVTRLGDGVHANRRLNDAAIGRTIAALAEYRELIAQHDVGRVIAVATSAARDASNSDDFFSQAEATLGVRPRLLSGQEEGAFTFAGATAGLPDDSYLVLDIGGGSTEFALGNSNAVEPVSIDTGCVRLTEQFLRSNPYRLDELADAFSVVEDYLVEVSSQLAIITTQPRLIGVAGTITSVASIDQGLTSYDRDKVHHYRLTTSAVEEIFRTVSMQTEAERRADPTMPPQRSDVLVAGMIVLLSVLRHFHFEDCLVADSDILEGLVAHLRHETA